MNFEASSEPDNGHFPSCFLPANTWKSASNPLQHRINAGIIEVKSDELSLGHPTGQWRNSFTGSIGVQMLQSRNSFGDIVAGRRRTVSDSRNTSGDACYGNAVEDFDSVYDGVLQNDNVPGRKTTSGFVNISKENDYILRARKDTYETVSVRSITANPSLSQRTSSDSRLSNKSSLGSSPAQCVTEGPYAILEVDPNFTDGYCYTSVAQHSSRSRNRSDLTLNLNEARPQTYAAVNKNPTNRKTSTSSGSDVSQQINGIEASRSQQHQIASVTQEYGEVSKKRSVSPCRSPVNTDCSHSHRRGRSLEKYTNSHPGTYTYTAADRKRSASKDTQLDDSKANTHATRHSEKIHTHHPCDSSPDPSSVAKSSRPSSAEQLSLFHRPVSEGASLDRSQHTLSSTESYVAVARNQNTRRLSLLEKCNESRSATSRESIEDMPQLSESYAIVNKAGYLLSSETNPGTRASCHTPTSARSSVDEQLLQQSQGGSATYAAVNKRFRNPERPITSNSSSPLSPTNETTTIGTRHDCSAGNERARHKKPRASSSSSGFVSDSYVKRSSWNSTESSLDVYSDTLRSPSDDCRVEWVGNSLQMPNKVQELLSPPGSVSGGRHRSGSHECFLHDYATGIIDPLYEHSLAVPHNSASTGNDARFMCRIHSKPLSIPPYAKDSYSEVGMLDYQGSSNRSCTPRVRSIDSPSDDRDRSRTPASEFQGASAEKQTQDNKIKNVETNNRTG